MCEQAEARARAAVMMHPSRLAEAGLLPTVSVRQLPEGRLRMHAPGVARDGD